MSRAVRATTAAAVGAVITMVGAPAAGAATGVTGLQSGYWWQGEATGAAIPAPPTVPASGLWVSSNPSGPQAISAVRFQLSPGASAPVLNLVVHQENPSGGAQIVACATTTPWVPPGGAGAWAKRPSADCSRGQVSGQAVNGGQALSFNLSSLVAGDQVDVVLMPAPATPLPPTFDATFEAVAPSNVAVQEPAPQAAAAPAAAPDSSISASPAQAPSEGAAPVAAAPAAAPATISPALAANAPVGLPSLAAPPPSPSAAPASAPSAVPASGTAVESSSSGPATIKIKGRSWRDRILLGLLILDLGAWLVIDSQRRSRSGRPALTLYDIPGARRPLLSSPRAPRLGRGGPGRRPRPATPVPALSAGRREGKPPPLR